MRVHETIAPTTATAYDITDLSRHVFGYWEMLLGIAKADPVWAASYGRINTPRSFNSSWSRAKQHIRELIIKNQRAADEAADDAADSTEEVDNEGEEGSDEESVEEVDNEGEEGSDEESVGSVIVVDYNNDWEESNDGGIDEDKEGEDSDEEMNDEGDDSDEEMNNEGDDSEGEDNEREDSEGDDSEGEDSGGEDDEGEDNEREDSDEEMDGSSVVVVEYDDEEEEVHDGEMDEGDEEEEEEGEESDGEIVGLWWDHARDSSGLIFSKDFPRLELF